MVTTPKKSLKRASERGYRHLVSIDDLTPPMIEALFNRAKVHQQMGGDHGSGEKQEKAGTQGKLAINVFLEPSTRTRVSFEVAELRLGMHVVNLGASESSISKGESDTDTRLTLEAYGPDVMVVRSRVEGLPQEWATEAGCAIINGGDGANEHPTQSLYDRFTIQEAFGAHLGKRILFVGDIAHSRVVGSHVRLAHLLGEKVYLAGPPEWTDVAAKFAAYPGAWEVVEFEEFLPEADVINPLRVQLERGAGEGIALEDYVAGWQVSEARLERAKPEAIVMHPAPVNRGVEIAEGLVVHQRSWIQEQARCGLWLRMAVLEYCLGGLS